MEEEVSTIAKGNRCFLERAISVGRLATRRQTAAKMTAIKEKDQSGGKKKDDRKVAKEETSGKDNEKGTKQHQ